MNDPIKDTRFANADAMTPARFVTTTANANAPLEVATVSAQNAATAGILVEANRFAGDAIDVAVGGGPVPLEAGGAFPIDSLLISDNVGRGIVAPVTSALTNFGARSLQASSGAGVFVSVLPIKQVAKY